LAGAHTHQAVVTEFEIFVGLAITVVIDGVTAFVEWYPSQG
jgi:hypothetical protein